MRLIVLMLATGLLPAHAFAQTASAPPFDDGRLFVRSVSGALTAPVRWTRGDVLKLPAAVIGLGALSLLDAGGRDLMRRNQSKTFDELTDGIEPFGTIENYKVLGAFYLYGLLANDTRARAVAAEGVASSVVAGALITPAIQFIVGRNRPRTDRHAHTFESFSGHHSFPSGHTTQAFAVAAVIATEYDEWWVKAASYGIASLVGFSRMYNDGHYLTDVTAAAMIGTVVGHGIAQQRRASEVARMVKPVIRPYGVGIEIPLDL